MLTRFDEYLIHQTPEPLAHPVSMDRNFYDRYGLSGFAADASLYFGISLRLYPNREVMDGAFSLVRGGEQRSCFASRRADPAHHAGIAQQTWPKLCARRPMHLISDSMRCVR